MLPSEEVLCEFFSAKREYLEEMLKLEKDMEKKRIIELNLQRTGSAEATLKGNSRREDLVASELRSISEAYRRESESTNTTEHLHEIRDFGADWIGIPGGLYENMSEL